MKLSESDVISVVITRKNKRGEIRETSLTGKDAAKWEYILINKKSWRNFAKLNWVRKFIYEIGDETIKTGAI
jgi:hypothetical protein